MGDSRHEIKELEFNKFHGAGNDFIVVDNRDQRYTELLKDEKFITELCSRHFGVDADGVVEVRRHVGDHVTAGNEAAFYSNRGYPYNMCGNGSRIYVTYLKKFGIHTGSDDVTFLAADGVHTGNHDPVAMETWVSIRDLPVTQATRLEGNLFMVNTGLPHMVVFVDYDVREVTCFKKKADALATRFQEFEGLAEGQSQMLVNFVWECDGVLHSRCWNRYLDREIIGCGTATGAIGVASCIRSDIPTDSHHEARIQWPGGLMRCSLLRGVGGFSDIRISGPIRHVYKGTFYLNSITK